MSALPKLTCHPSASLRCSLLLCGRPACPAFAPALIVTPGSAVPQWDDKHFSYNFDVRKGKVFTEWFRGGRTNIAYNCLDRHVAEGRGGQTAILWEGNDPGIDRKLTYQEVLDDVCRLVRRDCRYKLLHLPPTGLVWRAVHSAACCGAARTDMVPVCVARWL